MIKNRLHVLLNGLNQNYFVNTCAANNICIKNYIRHNKNKSSFVMTLKDFELAQKKDIFKFYSYTTRLIGGPRYILMKLSQRIGLVIGLAIFLLTTFFLNQKILKVEISSASETLKSEILEYININSCGVGTDWKSINISKLESNLFSSINGISSVSVKKIGTTLKITALSSVPTNSRSQNIVAPEDCVIEYIQVAKGNQLAHVGEIIKKGQTIVEMVDGKVEADVKVRLYHQSSVAVSQFKKEKQRTGEYISKSKIIWPWQKAKFDFSSDYYEYEKEIQITNISSGIILPLKKITVTYFKLNDFEVEENYAIEKSKQKALLLATAEFGDYEKVIYEIREVNGQKFVDCFAEAVISL